MWQELAENVAASSHFDATERKMWQKLWKVPYFVPPLTWTIGTACQGLIVAP
jgi:hypothetical protein